MKQRLKDAGIALLALISAALMLFSAYGLYSRFKGQSADTPLEEMHQPGENPGIDSSILDELNRICYETDFVYKTPMENRTAYSGRHTETFTNTTGRDFSDLYLQLVLYKVDNPSLYDTVESIPHEPMATYEIYRGELKNGESVPLSFSIERDDYNYVSLGYWYIFADE